MMATDATTEKPDVSVNEPSLALTDATESDSQNGHLSSSALNGPGTPDEIENKQIADIVDELVNSAEVSVSGGSDTEASTSRLHKSLDDKGHVRSSSVKKPQSFKSVSVNRTFLAAKGSTNPTARPDSAGTTASSTPTGVSGSSASKLKLVAKSGTSLGGPNKPLGANGKPAATPDASTVWNRNRPVPVPEPKKMSDEELIKYGIHMADRLRPEDDRGQNNWADIDDDEEWAPDTITWTDGTKITLPQAQVDEIPPTPPVIPAVIAAPLMPKEVIQPEKPRSPAPVANVEARASPSIKSSVLASGKGLILKGAPEKPTLVAKAPALPTPAKSPWAPLPPVDRASPVVTDLPNQQYGAVRGYPPRDPAFGNSMTPPPAKEIAADDFSRSGWRENQAGGNRELFNSHSGRYEPVNDRRGSRNEPRNDGYGSRQPAVLQRPTQYDQQGPAEPSAAFQTNRTSGQDSMPYGRRRGSSNVSGGSGGFAPRLGKPLEMPLHGELHGRSGSPASLSTVSPVTAQAPRGQTWQARPSPGQAHATPHLNQPAAELPSVPVPQQISVDEELELQKKLMRERREMAIKRRQEEEAQEEAAKKERLRLKLAALGPAPERKSTRKDDAKDTPTQIQRRDSVSTAPTPKPEATSEKLEPIADAVKPAPARPDHNNKPPSQMNGGQRPYNQSDRHQGGPGRPAGASGAQTASPWPESQSQPPSDRLASWSGASQTSSRNVWAAPGNDRSLGNGTFNADLGDLADSQPTQPPTAGARPAPIGPPTRAVSQGQAQQPRADQPPGRLAPIGPPGGRPGPGQPQGSGQRSNPWTAADIAASDRALRLENHRRRDEQVKDLASQGLSLEDAQASVRDTWRAVNLNDEGKRVPLSTSTKIHGEPREVQPNSWNQSSSANEPSRHDSIAQPISQDYRQHPGQNGTRNDARDFQGRQPPLGPTRGTAPGHGGQPRAGSRFFPPGSSRDIRQEETEVQSRSKSPTPPPPTMDGHPAYDGDVLRPHVALPPAKPIVKLPPPAVRLPPSSAAVQQQAPIAPPKPAQPISFAAAVAAGPPRPPHSASAARPTSRGAPGASQTPHEIATQENWQDKINNLFKSGRPSPGKPSSVDSASKSAFEYAHPHVSATVSLPSLSSASSTTTEDSSYISREMAEECFGEQEMGSLPLVRLPNKAPEALWHAIEPNWNPTVARFRVDPTVVDNPRHLSYWDYGTNNKTVIRVSVPGMNEPKAVPARFPPRNNSNPRRQGRGTPRHVSRGGRGGRDSSSSNGHGEQVSTPSSERPDRPERSERPERPERSDRTPSNRGRGSYRGRSDLHWSRHNPSTQTTQS